MPNRMEDGLLPHIKADYGTTIDPSIIKKDEVGVSCEMKRGDILFINRFTPHRGTLNKSNYVRWSIDLRFQKTGTPTGRHFWPEFIAKTSTNQTVQNNYEDWKKRWINDLETSKGERWHRVSGTGDF
jgi:phytanoyl-CoA hydroxylase